jgi:protein-L-isoaspartate(D-aspartate) O-methyltransferase
MRDDLDVGHRAMLAHLREERACDERVLAAMDGLRRRDFLPPDARAEADSLRPVPIGHGQTMSAPFIVASMTALLELSPGLRALEIGTGCGYQSAVLLRMGVRLWSIEIKAEVARLGAENLTAHGLAAELRVGDGGLGWPDAAPFDRIIVAATAPRIPERLLEQLAVGGVMVLPVETSPGHESMVRVRRLADGRLEAETLYGVRFVPMVGVVRNAP